MIQNVGKDVGACKFKGKGAAVIDNAATGKVGAAIAGIGNVAEVTVGMGIVQCAVFANILYVIAHLHLLSLPTLLASDPRSGLARYTPKHPPGFARSCGMHSS